MNEGDVYWDSGTHQFMKIVDKRPGAVTSGPATHEEIKGLLDGALAGRRDLLDAVGRALGETR